MLDTDQLRSFLAIVDTGSFTRAGERVNKTQSAVSMHIRRLEEQLGCALFVKQGRTARLTSEGERLIEFARRMMQIEAAAMAALSRKGLRGAVRLGIPDDYAEAFLADILTSFNRRHPLVEVAVNCENSTELGAQVHAGAIDIALVTDYEGLQGFELIREQPLVWVAAKRFKPEKGAPIPLAEGSANCLWRKVTDAALRPAGRDARPVLLQELHRDRHGRARRPRRDGPAARAGYRRSARARRGGGPAESAADPHGAHSRAGPGVGGSQGAGGGGPRHRRRRGRAQGGVNGFQPSARPGSRGGSPAKPHAASASRM